MTEGESESEGLILLEQNNGGNVDRVKGTTYNFSLLPCAGIPPMFAALKSAQVCALFNRLLHKYALTEQV